MNAQANRVVPASQPPDPTTDEPLLRVLVDALAYADAHEYRGTDYGAGLPGTVRRAVTALLPTLRSPFGDGTDSIHLDRSVGERYRDFEGTAQYLAASLTCDDLLADIGFGGTDDASGPDRANGPDCDNEPGRASARQLADWLLAHRSPGYAGFCGGRPALHHGGEPGPRRVPDVVSTATAVDALLSMDDDAVTQTATTAARFVTADLSYRTTPAGTIVDPYPVADPAAPTPAGSPSTVARSNQSQPVRPPVVALAAAARLFVALYETTGRNRDRDRATRLLDTVADAREPTGGWSTPARGLPYATSVGAGRTLEAFARYARGCSPDRYRGVLRDGLDWYRSTFFTATGPGRAPRDVIAARTLVGAAQGVVTFTIAGELPFAERVLRSAHRHLYAGDGRYYAGGGRFGTRRVTPVSRVHAPMTHALATYLDAVRDRAHPRWAVP